MESSLNELGNRAIQAVHEGAKILVLDDTSLTHENSYAMPILLALSHVHQLLIREGLRMETSLIAQSVKHEKFITLHVYLVMVQTL